MTTTATPAPAHHAPGSFISVAETNFSADEFPHPKNSSNPDMPFRQQDVASEAVGCEESPKPVTTQHRRQKDSLASYFQTRHDNYFPRSTSAVICRIFLLVCVARALLVIKIA